MNNPSTIPKSTDSADPENWLELYGDFLYRRALLLLSKPENAEDLVQDTLLSAYQSQSGFRGESSVKTWLATILRNKAIDFMRKAVRREIPTSFEDNPAEDSKDFTSWGIWKDWQEKLGIWNSSGYDQLESRALISCLMGCIEKLPSNQRNIIKLKVFEDLPIEEICKELEIKPTNAGVLLFRARLALRNCVDLNWFKKV